METKEYERLASAYLDCVYRAAVNGCNNYADAEDVVQNTFMKLWEKENYFEDYPTKEIARIMGISETAVQTRLLRARQKLKEKLKEDGKE